MSSPTPSPSINENAPLRQSSFAALRYRDFRLLWFGQMVSTTGSQMQLAAINWHVYLLTKSSWALGLIGLVRVIPIILCSLLGGVVADAVDRKRMIVVTQTVMLLSACVLAIVTGMGLQSAWPIYLLTAISSAAVAFDNPARQALLPMLVPAEVFPNAVSLGLIAFHIATVAGPALAGLILATRDCALVYGFNALSFLAVVAAVLLMRVTGRAAVDKDEASRVSVEALRDGLRFVWRTPIIVQTMTLDFIATFFASATALLPIFAAEILHVGARGFGILQAAPAAGSVITAVVMARWGTIRRQGMVVILAVGVYGAATIGFGLSSLLGLTFDAGVDGGSGYRQHCAEANDSSTRDAEQSARSDDFNQYDYSLWAGPQLGELEAGGLAALIGVQLSVMTGGVGCLVAVGLAMLMAKNLVAYKGNESNIVASN